MAPMQPNLVGGGSPSDTCGQPVILTAHHGVVITVPHRCSSSRCSMCIDHGWVRDETERILDKLQRRIMGRVQLDKGRWRGRTLKVYSFKYSLERHEYDNVRDYKRDRSRMYKHLRHHGLLSGWCIGHPFRGEHGPNDNGPVIRSAMDQTKQSWHWHGIAIGWFTEPVQSGSGYYLNINKLAEFKHGVVPSKKWGYFYKSIRYWINHAGSFAGTLPISRFGKWPWELSWPRPKAVALWKHPDTKEVFAVQRPIYRSREERGLTDWKHPRYQFDDDKEHPELKRELASSILWHTNPQDTMGYHWIKYESVKIAPDDALGIQWDALLMSFLV